jgi:hypothetical protein
LFENVDTDGTAQLDLGEVSESEREREREREGEREKCAVCSLIFYFMFYVRPCFHLPLAAI